jgi:hypothetical protein
MSGLLLALAASLPALQAQLVAPAGITMPAELNVRWWDTAGQALTVTRVKADGGLLRTSPPLGGAIYQVSVETPALISKRMAISNQSQLLSLMTPARIRVEGLEGTSGKTLRAYLLAASDPPTLPPGRFEMPPGSVRANQLELAVPPDRYLVALDTGSARQPWVSEEIDAAPASSPLAGC